MDPLGSATRNPFVLAERLLGIIKGALDNGVPYCHEAPTRCYVAHGTPVLDFLDQLTVHVSSIRPSSAFVGDAGGPLSHPKLILVDLTVTLVNSYPTGVIQQQGGKVRAIDAETFAEASDLSYATGWTAYSAAWYGWGTECTLHSLSPLQPLDPEGGAAGWQFVLTTEIPRLRQEV